MHRALGAYLSVRNQVQLAVKSIARRIIGYTPGEDNSQIRFADKIAKIMAVAQETPSLDG
ncbi:MAG TPA: hypothetical protein EYQ20_02680 [candidate division Zixibacteria bacterium]|jgi:hypothetical protein|nr:hypothetical protein [candidate division Zixibacteria bacterium]